MKVFMCDLDPEDRRYCIADSGGFPGRILIAVGQPARARLHQSGRDAVRLTLDEHRGGLELPDLVSNIENLLILRKACAERIIATHQLGAYELLPAILANSKGRVHSRDYVIVNLIGIDECLDMDRSEMNGLQSAPWVKIFGKFWLDAARVPRDRDIFRVKSVSTGYMFSERLFGFIGAQGFTNFVFQDVGLS